MRGVNKSIIVGTIGQDPEVRNGVTSISVAVNEEWKDRVTGEKVKRTEWIRVKFFGRLAEVAGEYLKKGSQVYVEGSQRTDKYTDKQGIERYATAVIAQEMQMIGGKSDGEQRPQRDTRGNAQRPARAETPPPIDDEPFPEDGDPIPF